MKLVLISVLFIILNLIRLVNIFFKKEYSYLCNILGHIYGPISPEMNATLRVIDDYVGKLLKIIDSNDYLKTNLNVIITSDHGMHQVNKTLIIFLEKYVDKSLFSAYGGRTFANIFVKNSKYNLILILFIKNQTLFLRSRYR